MGAVPRDLRGGLGIPEGCADPLGAQPDGSADRSRVGERSTRTPSVSRRSPQVLAAAAGPVWRRVRGAVRFRLVPQRRQRAGLRGSGSGLDAWAEDNQWKSRIGGFLILLAGFVFLHFAGTIRSVLGSAEATGGGPVQLARVAFAGAITGITGITMAIVMIAAAATEGADADPVVSERWPPRRRGRTSSPRWASPRCSRPPGY